MKTALILVAAALWVCCAATTAAALTACTSAEIIAQEPACPPGDGPCVITKSFRTKPDDACTLDFGARAVVISGSVGGFQLTLLAGSLTIEPGGSIRGVPFSDFDTFGGSVQIDIGGDVLIRRTPPYNDGVIDVSAGGYGGGQVELVSEHGHVTIEGQILANGLARQSTGGYINIWAFDGVTTGPDSLLQTNAGAGDPEYLPESGFMDIAGRIVELGGRITSHGQDPEGGVHVSGGDVAITGTVSTDGYYDQASAAGVVVRATGSLMVSGTLSAKAGPGSLSQMYGFSGSAGFTLEGDEEVVIDGALVADGALYGCAGSIFLESRGEIRLADASSVSARNKPLHDSYCQVGVVAEAPRFVASGSISLDNGGVLDVNATDYLRLGGTVDGKLALVDADASGAPFGAWRLDLTAGRDSAGQRCARPGQMVIDGKVDFGATGCDQGVCGRPGNMRLRGCEIVVAEGASILGRAVTGADVALEACKRLDLAGAIDVRGTNEDGQVSVSTCGHLQTQCAVGGDIDPPPQLFGTCSRCPGDCDGDGTLTTQDVQVLVGRITLCDGFVDGSPCAVPACRNADLDGDGRLSPREFAYILDRQASSGACPMQD